jgi:hypothetical protein
VIDSGLADPDWDKVLWNETGGFEGGGTDIMMQVRCSDAIGDLSSASYQEVAASGGGIRTSCSCAPSKPCAAAI